MLLRLVLVILALFCLGKVAYASTLATVCSVGFSPYSGGPGTVVRVLGSQCYGDRLFLVQPGFRLPNQSAAPGPPQFQPLGNPIASTKPDLYGNIRMTFTVPARLPDGSPITNRGLVLKVTGPNGSEVAEAGGEPIFVITSALPGTGNPIYSILLTLLASAVLLILGLFVRRIRAAP
jgi:hypothetical protein